jgi:glycerol-3-phosphate dehydrogenase (NAD(P)+)
MKIGIIGLGNIGTSIANLIAQNGYNIIAWEYNINVVNEVNTKKVNSIYLPNIPLDSKIQATTQIEEVPNNSEIIFIAIPSIYIKPVLEKHKNNINNQTIIVNLAKGIDKETYFTACETLSNIFPNNNIVMLSGPTIANEFSRKMPTVVVLAHKNKQILLKVSKILENNYFRTRFSDDIIGAELGGILKNIYAIGLGILVEKK